MRTKDPWKIYPTPRPAGYVHGLPNLNGELIRWRGQVAVMLLRDGKEIDVHLEHFVKAGK